MSDLISWFAITCAVLGGFFILVGIRDWWIQRTQGEAVIIPDGEE